MDRTRRQETWNRIVKRKWLYIMFIPVAIWYLAFCYAPLFGLVSAFQNFSLAKGFFGSSFIGLQNFERLFSSPYFVDSIRNTLIINSLRILIGFPIPIIFALMLNEVRHSSFKRIAQTVTYIPHFISWVIMTGILTSLLVIDMNGTTNAGGINVLLATVGLPQVDFMNDPKVFRQLLIVTDIWKEFGWNSIIFLAAISGVDPTLYEASIIDGASRLQRAIRITLPCIFSTIAIMLILNVGNIFIYGFDQTYNMMTGATQQVADTMDTFIVRTIWQASGRNYLGLGAAANMIRSLLAFTILILFNAFMRKAFKRSLF